MTTSAFQGRVAVITGGARGFGRAFGRALSAQGAQIVLVDLDRDAADRTAAQIARDGGRAIALECDVADETQVGDMVSEVVAQFGGIDVLINNAGLHSTEYLKTMAELGPANLRRLFDVNVIGVAICTMAARSAMAGRPGACVVNMSSVSSYGVSHAYGVSKLAVRGMTIAWAHELAGDAIRVNAIAPGLVLTDTIAQGLTPERKQRAKNLQLLPLDGAEDDIVNAMLFLCSDRSRFITGETLRVSAGSGLSA